MRLLLINISFKQFKKRLGEEHYVHTYGFNLIGFRNTFFHVDDSVNLLEDSLTQPPIAQTKSFTWLATPIGIAALCRANAITPKPPFDEAVKEAFEVSIDLSREEREFHQTEQGLVLLFYS